MQRQAMIFPPPLAVGQPAEHFGRKNVAVGIDHRFFRGDIVADRRAQPVFGGKVAQRRCRAVDVFDRADTDPLYQCIKIDAGAFSPG